MDGDAESVRKVIGPTLPPQLRGSNGEGSKDGDVAVLPSSQQDGLSNAEQDVRVAPRRILGPSMPPPSTSQSSAHEASVSSATQAFLAREQRMREAVKEVNTASRDDSPATETARPEWMLALPTAQSFSEAIQKDPSAALKNRGFSQAQNVRVQKGRGGAGLGGAAEEDSSLWTETPQEREQRLREEEMGIRAKGGEASSCRQETAEERSKRIAEQAREEKIQQAIAAHQATRGPTLLEQHQAQRRKDYREGGAKSDRHSESSSRHRHSRDERSEHKKRRRERSRSTSSSSSDSDTGRRRRSRSRDRGHSRREDKVSSHRKSKDDREEGGHRHRRRTASQERERDERKREKRKEREKKEKRRRRQEEEKEEKKGAPMMVWDREAAMSVGGKLMGDQKRMDAIRSAATLSSRFGASGSSRYL